MPWRGAERLGEFPTLGYLVADWIQEHCVIPDRHVAGLPFVLTDEQLLFVLWHYRLHPAARVDYSKPGSAWLYDGSVLVRPQKWGKGPLAAAMVCAEAEGPVLFAGWDAEGEPLGRPWPTPHIQITAVSEDQTDNTYRSLLPMIELGALSADIPDTGLTRINLANGGLIEPVTASARSRLGQRITFAVQDETHSWLARNGGLRLADNQRRNLAGMGGRWVATTNAYDPLEESVAQLDVERSTKRVYIDYPEPLVGSWRNKRDRRRILRHAYKGAHDGIDLNRIEAECDRLEAKGDPGQAERFFGNRSATAKDAAFDLELWRSLVRPDAAIAAGQLVTLGFDGARHFDSTALVATELATGLQQLVALWERPEHLHADDEWEISESEVDEVVAAAFERWSVWRLYADPPYWESAVDRWAAQHLDRRGRQLVHAWYTRRRTPMALALQAWHTSMVGGEVGHNGDERLERHIANARRVDLTGMLDSEGHPLWMISKDRPGSPRKIDAAMAACLSWEARGDAIADGALVVRRRRVVMA